MEDSVSLIHLHIATYQDWIGRFFSQDQGVRDMGMIWIGCQILSTREQSYSTEAMEDQ